MPYTNLAGYCSPMATAKRIRHLSFHKQAKKCFDSPVCGIDIILVRLQSNNNMVISTIAYHSQLRESLGTEGASTGQKQYKTLMKLLLISESFLRHTILIWLPSSRTSKLCYVALQEPMFNVMTTCMHCLYMCINRGFIRMKKGAKRNFAHASPKYRHSADRQSWNWLDWVHMKAFF